MEPVTELFRADLDEATAKLFASAPRLAWDIETSGLDPAADQIATVQLHAPEVGTTIVQVDRSLAPRRICGLLERPDVLKVFHHAMFDLRFMVFHWQVRPANIGCTKVASKLLWPAHPRTQHTLKSLLAEQLGVVISKEQRLSDWSAPQLSPEQISYARADVEYLLPLLDCLEPQLTSAGLQEYLAACLAFLPTRVRLEIGNWPDVFGY